MAAAASPVTNGSQDRAPQAAAERDVAEVQRTGREAADGPDDGDRSGQRVERRVAGPDGEREAEQYGPDHEGDRHHNAATQKLAIRLLVITRNAVDQRWRDDVLDTRTPASSAGAAGSR